MRSKSWTISGAIDLAISKKIAINTSVRKFVVELTLNSVGLATPTANTDAKLFATRL